MSKDSYRFGEIILGFRDKYLEEYNKLNELRQFVTVNSNKVKDFHFILMRNNIDGYPYLGVVFEENPDKIKQLFHKKVHITQVGTLNIYDINNIYISSIYDTTIKDMDSFSKTMNERLDSFFVNNIKERASLSYKDLRGEFSFNFQDIKLKLTDDVEHSSYITSYDVCEDRFVFEYLSPNDCRRKLMLSDILDINIPNYLLSPYHQSIVDGSDKSMKKIVFSGWSDIVTERQAFYEFDNSKDDKAVLRKIKNTL